jgi:hypothetical protein
VEESISLFFCDSRLAVSSEEQTHQETATLLSAGWSFYLAGVRLIGGELAFPEGVPAVLYDTPIFFAYSANLTLLLYHRFLFITID